MWFSSGEYQARLPLTPTVARAYREAESDDCRGDGDVCHALRCSLAVAIIASQRAGSSSVTLMSKERGVPELQDLHSVGAGGVLVRRFCGYEEAIARAQLLVAHHGRSRYDVVQAVHVVGVPREGVVGLEPHVDEARSASIVGTAVQHVKFRPVEKGTQVLPDAFGTPGRMVVGAIMPVSSSVAAPRHGRSSIPGGRSSLLPWPLLE